MSDATTRVASRAASRAVDEVLGRLRLDGSRVTASRVAVVDALVNGRSHHVTAVDLLRTLRRDRPDFQESTVYRTLDRLVEVGAVTRIEVDGGPSVFHLAESAHHHVVCERCGRVVGVDAALLEPVARRLRRDHGFVLRADAVTLPGRCVDCAADRPGDVGGHHHGSVDRADDPRADDPHGDAERVAVPPADYAQPTDDEADGPAR